MFRNKFVLLPLLGIFSLLVIGTFVAVELGRRQQDTRNQASVANGPVIVTGRSSVYAAGQPGEFILSINTSQVNIDGVQLSFRLAGSANPGVSNPAIEAISGSGLTVIGSPVITPMTDATGGYQIVVALAAPIPQTFSSNTPIDFLRIRFTHVAGNTVHATFDPICDGSDGNNLCSRANQSGGSTIVDVLRNIPQMVSSPTGR